MNYLCEKCSMANIPQAKTNKKIKTMKITLWNFNLLLTEYDHKRQVIPPKPNIVKPQLGK